MARLKIQARREIKHLTSKESKAKQCKRVPIASELIEDQQTLLGHNLK